MQQIETKLYDLIEYRWDYYLKKFFKVKTHLYNKPYSLCVGEKNKILFHTPPPKSTRFKIVLNGAKQYSNQFKDEIKKTIENKSTQLTLY